MGVCGGGAWGALAHPGSGSFSDVLYIRELNVCLLYILYIYTYMYICMYVYIYIYIYIYHSLPGKIPADIRLVNKCIGTENIFKKICCFCLC